MRAALSGAHVRATAAHIRLSSLSMWIRFTAPAIIQNRPLILQFKIIEYTKAPIVIVPQLSLCGATSKNISEINLQF